MLWKTRKRAIAMALLVCASLLPAAGYAHRSKPDHEVVGYFIEWGIYGRNYKVKDVVTNGAADVLTVIQYAFGNVAPLDPSVPGSPVVCKLGDEWADYQKPWTAAESVEGLEVTWPRPMLGNFQQLKALKERYPRIRNVISLGGWTWSKYFSDAALTDESRKAFVKSCVDLFIRGDLPNPGWGGMGGPGAAAGVFDGIDVDWEFPASEGNPGNIVRPEDTRNFTLLLREFRRQLNEIDHDLLLTVALPAGEAKYSKIELNKIHRYLDFMSIMTYDFHGGWELTTNHQAALYPNRDDPTRSSRFTASESVRGYLRAGVPERKIVMGTPFYSRGWTGVNPTNAGLFQPATGLPPGTWETGIDDYKVAKNKPGFTRYWDRRAEAAWLFDGTTFWTFDDEEVVLHKTRFIKKKGLRGIMFWELSGDDGSLIRAIQRGFSERWHHRDDRWDND